MRVLTEPSHTAQTSENVLCFSLFSSRVVHKVQNLLQSALLAVQFSRERLTECPPRNVVVLTKLDSKEHKFARKLNICQESCTTRRALCGKFWTMWTNTKNTHNKSNTKQKIHMCSKVCPLKTVQSRLTEICVFQFVLFLTYFVFFDIVCQLVRLSCWMQLLYSHFWQCSFLDK